MGSRSGGFSWGEYGPLRASWLACAASWFLPGPDTFGQLRRVLGPLLGLYGREITAALERDPLRGLAAKITGSTPPMAGTVLASSRAGAPL